MFDPGIKKLLISASVSSRSAWAIVRDGVVAEFCIDNDKPVHRFDNNTLTVETSKARMEITFDDSIEPVVAETAEYKCSPWVQCIYLCIPEEEAHMSQRRVLTHVGSYESDQLWDLGVGNDSMDACVIANDAETQEKLREREGRYIIDDSEFLHELIKLSPPRLFRTKFASIMVKQRIPSNGEHVDGPHTHLLPSIIINGTHFPIPIPDSRRSLIQVDPYGSVIDGTGDHYGWSMNDPFQSLLKEYAETYVGVKMNMRNRIMQSLQNGDLQSVMNEYADKDKQDMMRIVIAQIVCDSDLDIDLRKKALSMLESVKAINLYGIKQWSHTISPELLR